MGLLYLWHSIVTINGFLSTGLRDTQRRLEGKLGVTWFSDKA
jgi:hypothetical protein